MSVVVFLAGALSLAGIYAILALILNLEAGWAGLWDFSLAGLLGVGAYTYIITTVAPDRYDDLIFSPGLPIWAGILISAAVTALVAFLIGVPALRLRGEYFFITTFAFAEVMRQMFVVQSDVTRGVVGFSQVERPFDDIVSGADYRYVLLGIIVVVLLILLAIMRRVGRSPHGTALRAMRDNESLVGALGKSTTRYRLQTFVVAGALIGLVAPLYVWYIRSVVPQLFVSDISFTVWTALIIGGLASFTGPIIGAIVLIVGTEAILLIPTSPENATLLTATRPLLLGLALVLFLRFRPQGIVSERWAFRRKPGTDGEAAVRRAEAGPEPAVKG